MTLAQIVPMTGAIVTVTPQPVATHDAVKGMLMFRQLEVPILGIVVAGYLMASLPATTWYRLIGWLILGLFIYFFYGRKHSKVQQTAVTAASPRR